jgi:DNA-binding beta-propeller fold protein YncE
MFVLASVLACSAPAVASAKSGGVTQIKVSNAPADQAASGVEGIAVNPSSQTVVAIGTLKQKTNADYAQGRVWVIDGRKDKLVATLHLSGAAYAGIGVDTATDTFYVADSQLPNPAPEQPGGVAVINGRTHKVTATISVPGIGTYVESGRAAVAVDSNTDTIYTDGASYTVTVINGRTNAVAATVQNTPYPGPLSVDLASDTVYEVGGASGGTTGVWAINGHTDMAEGLTTASSVTIPTATSPDGVAVDSKAGRIYVTGGNEADAVEIIHRGASRIAHTIKLANANVGSVAVDTGTHSVYVASGNVTEGCQGFVTEINGKTNKVTATVNGINGTAVAVDSAHDRVWVTDGDKVDAFRGGYSRKAKKCGAGGITLGG